MKKTITILLATVLFGSMASADIEVRSLESELKGDTSSSQWRQDAVYSYSGRGHLKVAQVHPGNGVLGTGGGLLVHLDGDFGVPVKFIFIRGKTGNIVDGDKLPAIDVKVDGIYQYQTALGSVATIRAFRRLTLDEEKKLDEQRKVWRQQDEELAKQERARLEAERLRREAELKALKKRIASQMEDLERSYAEDQEMAKKEVARFFSSLEINFQKSVYISRTMLPLGPKIVVRNVKLDELREAKEKKDWNRCLRLTYDNYYRSKGSPEMSLDSRYSKEAFPKLREYDFIGKGEHGLSALMEARGKKDWNKCLNIARQILGQEGEVLEYPDTQRLKSVFLSLLKHEFTFDLEFNCAESSLNKESIIVIRKDDEFIREVKKCEGSRDDDECQKNARLISMANKIFMKCPEKVSMQMAPIYITTSDELRNITGQEQFIKKRQEYLRQQEIESRGMRHSSTMPVEISDLYLIERIERLRNEYRQEKISEADYNEGIVDVSRIVDKRLEDKFVVLNRRVKQETQAELSGYVRQQFENLNFDMFSSVFVDPQWSGRVSVSADSWPGTIERLIQKKQWLDLINEVYALTHGKGEVKSGEGFLEFPDKAIIDELLNSLKKKTCRLKFRIIDRKAGAGIVMTTYSDSHLPICMFTNGEINRKIGEYQDGWKDVYKRYGEECEVLVCPYEGRHYQIFVVEWDNDVQKLYDTFIGTVPENKTILKTINGRLGAKCRHINRADYHYLDGGNVVDRKARLTVNGMFGGASVEGAAKDKALFARLWKSIPPKDKTASKLDQDISRLREGLGNEALAKIYDKYMEVKCCDVQKEFLSAVSRCRKESELDEVRRAYKEKFLTRLSERMDQIINGSAGQKDSGAGNKPQGTTSSTVTWVKCPECNGGRYIKDESACMSCNGQGKVEKVKLGLNGASRRTISNCSQCLGTGVITKKTPCTTCKGSGKIRNN